MKLPIQAKPITRKVSTVRISADGITPSIERCINNPCSKIGYRCTADGYCVRESSASIAVALEFP
ncbi:MAG TPA: hypothetical protein VIJ25_03800 [Methylococcales bacterium]